MLTRSLICQSRSEFPGVLRKWLRAIPGSPQSPHNECRLRFRSAGCNRREHRRCASLLPGCTPLHKFKRFVTHTLRDFRYLLWRDFSTVGSNPGEKRARVENLCLGVTSDLMDVFYNANQQAVVAFVAKMGSCKFQEPFYILSIN